MIPVKIDRLKLPHKPGVYIFKDKEKRIIYVGKAIDLYHRVSSYFSKQNQNPKTSVLVTEIYNVETIIVESELEALILEANLIKKYLPPFNVRLTDDKDYLYIKVTKHDYPKIVTVRKQDLKDALKYFGPFPSSTTVKKTLQSLRKIFPWCTNPPKLANSSQLSANRLKPCFYYHLRLCPGACIGLVSKQEYRKIINHFTQFMEGKKYQLQEELVKEMQQSSDNLNFEKASIIKKIISGIDYLTSPNRTEKYLENPNFLEQETSIALKELQGVLKLNEFPVRIEAYDISNIQGKDATGSLVVLTNGEIDKSQYRRFKIQIAGKPNDYAMHQEMMKRRLKHREWEMPQLFLIDGGRGQVRASKKELATLRLDTPIFGLAKRMEWVYPPEGEVIKLPKRSQALRLLQKIRDEAHRFAISYHRKLHRKSMGFK